MKKEGGFSFGVEPIRCSALTPTAKLSKKQLKWVQDALLHGVQSIISQFDNAKTLSVYEKGVNDRTAKKQNVVATIGGEVFVSNKHLFFKPTFSFPEPRSDADKEVFESLATRHPRFELPIVGHFDFRKSSFGSAITAAFAFGVALKQFERGNTESAAHAIRVCARHEELLTKAA